MCVCAVSLVPCSLELFLCFVTGGTVHVHEGYLDSCNCIGAASDKVKLEATFVVSNLSGHNSNENAFSVFYFDGFYILCEDKCINQLITIDNIIN